MRRHWSFEIVDYIRGKVPEIGEIPFYLRTVEEMPGLNVPANAAAFHHIALDVSLQPLLEARDQWEGRGIAIGIVDSERFFHTNWAQQVGLVLHELCHWFDHGDSTLRRPVQEWNEGDHFRFKADAKELAASIRCSFDHSKLNRAQHSHEFARAGLHCWRRCRFDIPLRDLVVFDDRYQSPDESQCFEALRDELAECSNIVDVMKLPAPPEYLDLWREQIAGSSNFLIDTKETKKELVHVQ